MSKLTVSPPRRLSKLSEVSTPLWWKKYSLPSSAAMNPNPRSETIFFTVPFGIAVLLLSNTEWNASALFEREECRPHARSPEGRATGRTLPHRSNTVHRRSRHPESPGRSAAIGDEFEPEADQGHAGGGLESTANSIPAQKIADSGHDHGIERQPAHGDRAEDQPQQQQALERRLASVDELREQAQKEDDDLGIAQVAEQTLPVSDASLEPHGRAGGGKLAKITLCEQRRPQRLEPEEDEIGGAGQTDREEERLGGDQQRRKPGTAGHGPGRQPGDDAGCRCDAAATPSDQRVADGERGVRARREDDEERNSQEGREVDAHDGGRIDD